MSFRRILLIVPRCTLQQLERCCCTKSGKTLTIKNMNQNVVVMEYAVRGPLVARAGEIEKELKSGAKKPFKEVIKANIGDCHAMGQRPMTFLRQILACSAFPKLLESDDYPCDVKERVKAVLGDCKGGSVGSYTDSPGIEVIRKQAAKYIEKRDCVPANYEDIFLTTGASDGIKHIMLMLIHSIEGKKPGVMVPVPMYPLYSATIAEYNMGEIGYYLEESKNWALDSCELQRAYDEGKKKYFPRAIVVINPGNPTGQVLEKSTIQDVIKFAHKNRLFILADEVYQTNIYDCNSQFHSFKKVMMEMGDPYCKMELASFHSVSKGYTGECGLRGGYVEIVNMDPDVRAMYTKCISAMLCPNSLGQIAMYVLMNPPKEGEPSYEQYMKERTEILGQFKLRANMVYEAFNSFEGFKCNVVQGALYAFPKITIPPKAVEEAKKKKQAPDTFYCFELLENTGICVVSGTGFGQQKGTFHFRTTILPPTDMLKDMLQKFSKFHQEFVKKYK